MGKKEDFDDDLIDDESADDSDDTDTDSDDDSISDNVGDASVEINVDDLISEMEAEGLPTEHLQTRSARKRLEEILEEKKTSRELIDFDDFDIDSDDW